MLINQRWHSAKEAAILADYLQSSVAREITSDVAYKISEKRGIRAQDARIMFLREWIRNAKLFISSVYEEIRPDIEEHAYNYPIKYFPCDIYCSYAGRKRHEMVQRILRSIPIVRGSLEPGKISEPVPWTILPGVDYTAESIVFGGFLKGTSTQIDKDLLEWSKKSSRADYCMGLVAFGSEDFETLTDAWLHGEVYSITDYTDSLDTLIEEVLHGCSDQIAKKPRYGEKDVDKEHYWMNEYGTFPERIFNAILKHGRAFQGSMADLLDKKSKSTA